MKKYLVFSLTISLCLMIACTEDTPIPKRATNAIAKAIQLDLPVNIYPGEKVGVVQLQDTWQILENIAHCEFLDCQPIAMGVNIIHPVEEKELGLMVYLNGRALQKRAQDPVTMIDITEPFVGATPEGISLGSTEEEVRVAYGNANRKRKLVDGEEWYFDQLGLGLDLNGGVVTQISIYAPKRFRMVDQVKAYRNDNRNIGKD